MYRPSGCNRMGVRLSAFVGPSGTPGRVRPGFRMGVRPASNQHLLQPHSLQPKGGPLMSLITGRRPVRRGKLEPDDEAQKAGNRFAITASHALNRIIVA